MVPRIGWPTSLLKAAPWAAVAFLAGILAHAGSPFERIAVGLWGGVVLAVLSVLFFCPLAWRYGIFAVVIGFFGGFFRFDITIPQSAPEGTFEGVVVGKGKYDIRVRDQASGVSVKLVSTRYRIGEHLLVTCGTLKPLDPAEEYATYNARQGLWFTCQQASVMQGAATSGWDPRRALLAWRQTLTWRIQRILPGDAGALLSGILYGERGLSTETSALFRAAGMTHLIAVSGSNIALVASLFVPLFLACGYRRKSAIILSGIAIMSFVLFVGAGASVVRAAVMGWLALLARVFGRRASAGRLLVIAATAIVLFDPWALAFDAGFALSFLATWGLLAWARPLQERCTWIPATFGIREAFTTTLAATMVTTPYSLWAFGQVSLAGLLTNVLAIPLVGLAMFWGTVALLLGVAFPWAALPARGSLEGMLLISHVAELTPWLQVSFAVPTAGLFLLYAWLWWTVTLRKRADRFYPHPEVFEVNMGGLVGQSVRKF